MYNKIGVIGIIIQGMNKGSRGMSSKNKVEVKIHGKEYTVVGTEPDEYIQKVALYVDKKMNEITMMNERLSTSMVAVLTAINVADEFFKCKQDLDNLRLQLQQYIEDLKRANETIKEYEKENSSLKQEVHNMQIELVKKETELNDFINSFDQNVKDNTVRFDSAKKARAK